MGWDLYATRLAAEWGWYSGPEQELGQILWELWHTACLVADTGLHSQGWSVEEAEQYLTRNSVFRRDLVAATVRDCIERPGALCAPAIGLRQILELRVVAESSSGVRFSPNSFHRALLEAGPLPHEVRRDRMRRWATSQY